MPKFYNEKNEWQVDIENVTTKITHKLDTTSLG